MINSQLEALYVAIELAMRLDEDYARTQEAMTRRNNIAVSPIRFKNYYYD